MALVCNIDERGQQVRRRMGWGLVGAGMVGLGLGWGVGGWYWWVSGGALVAGGVFALFEAKKKWCAVRAMGIKTRI